MSLLCGTESSGTDPCVWGRITVATAVTVSTYTFWQRLLYYHQSLCGRHHCPISWPCCGSEEGRICCADCFADSSALNSPQNGSGLSQNRGQHSDFAWQMLDQLVNLLSQGLLHLSYSCYKCLGVNLFCFLLIIYVLCHK